MTAVSAPLPDELIEQAEHLLSYREPPRETDVRRAVSSAYYAVFHLICTDAADLFAGKMQRKKPAHVYVYRSVDHRVLREICQAIQKQKPEIRAVQGSEFFTDQLRRFAANTIDLQAARHSADYDPAASHSVSTARANILSSREAIESYKLITQIERRTFLTVLTFRRRA